MSTGRIKWVRSWDGLEDQKLEIQQCARRVVETDAIVRSQFPSSVATGFICESMNNLDKARTPEIRAAAEAQNTLYELHGFLMDTHHLEFDFIRREWATILDPSPEEAELCKRLAKDPKDRIVKRKK
jgi:hypothetical protein